MPSAHIRPRIRKANAKASTNPTKQSTNSGDRVDDLERKVGSWIGLSSSGDDGQGSARVKSHTNSAMPTEELSIASASTPTPTPASSTAQPFTVSTTSSAINNKGTIGTTKPVGILKKPKYSLAGGPQLQPKPSIDGNNTAAFPTTKQSSTPVVCEQFVIERDPFQKPKRKTRTKTRNATNHATIEGYQPNVSPTDQTPAQSGVSFAATATKDIKQRPPAGPQSTQAGQALNDTGEEPQIILSSFEELFEAAGNEMPKNRSEITPETNLVEADLAFSVMTQEQYGEKVTEMKREMETEREDMYRMFLGNEGVFDQDDDEESEGSEGEEEFLNFLMEQQMEMNGEDYYDDDDDGANQQETAPRAFSLIWGAFSHWWTPEAVEWMARLEQPDDHSQGPLYGNNWSPQVDRSDIGASRCAGFMAMVKMYLPSSLREIGHPPDLQRKAESRIADWLRTFDYSVEAPKLPVNMWKAISCILLDMVLIENRTVAVEKLPPSVTAVGMTLDEYKYLTRSAVQAFQP